MSEIEITLDGRTINVPASVTQVNVVVSEMPTGADAPIVRLNASHDFDLVLITGAGDRVRVSPSGNNDTSVISFNLNPQPGLLSDTDGIVQVTGGGQPSWRAQGR